MMYTYFAKVESKDSPYLNVTPVILYAGRLYEKGPEQRVDGDKESVYKVGKTKHPEVREKELNTRGVSQNYDGLSIKFLSVIKGDYEDELQRILSPHRVTTNGRQREFFLLPCKCEEDVLFWMHERSSCRTGKETRCLMAKIRLEDSVKGIK